MTEYDNINKGAAWKNDKEGGSPTWPDYRGNLNVDGKEFFLDCWINIIKNGERKGQKFLKFAVKAKMARDQGGSKNPPAQKAKPQADFDDDVKF